MNPFTLVKLLFLAIAACVVLALGGWIYILWILFKLWRECRQTP